MKAIIEVIVTSTIYVYRVVIDSLGLKIKSQFINRFKWLIFMLTHSLDDMYTSAFVWIPYLVYESLKVISIEMSTLHALK